MKINFLKTFINITNIEEQKKAISEAIDKKRKKVFFYLNSYSFYLSEKNPLFNEAFNSADYVVPDGMSIVLGIKLLTNMRVEKVTPNHSFFDYLANEYSERNVSIFLLGSDDEALQKAVVNLNKDFPKLKIAGYHIGYFKEEESPEVIKKINSAKPDILFVGMGMPKSEIWIHKYYERFDDYLIFTVGNLIDIIAGRIRIAPRIFYNSGFEWMFRLIQEPKKLFFRYLKSNSYIIYKILSKKFL